MKNFILKTIVFFVLITIFAVLLDYAISKGLKSMKDYRFQSWNEIQNGINADIIVNGNSRALCNFVPVVFDSILHLKSYNLGFGGHTFNPQFLKYNYYTHHNSTPKILIQNVDFLTLSDMFVIGHEREQILPYVFDLYLNKQLQNYGFNFFDLKLPFIRYFGYQQEIKNGVFQFLKIRNFNNRVSEKGFLSEIGNWNPTELNKIEKINFLRDTFSVHLFEKFLIKLKENNVRVFLVYSPVYHRATKKFTDKAKMDCYFLGIAKKYGYSYLDYSSDSICMDSTMFVNALHMNERGARIFSEKLSAEIKSILTLNDLTQKNSKK